MSANRLRDDGSIFVVVTADHPDPETNGVNLRISAFDLENGSFEYYASVFAECGPELGLGGLIEFRDDRAVFMRGVQPTSIEIGNDDIGYDCSPRSSQPISSILGDEFRITATTTGLQLTGDDGQVDFVLTDLQGNQLPVAGTEDS